MEKIKEALISSMLSGQKTLEIGNVVFECLPTLKRDTQAKRELEAKREAEKLIQILNS